MDLNLSSLSLPESSHQVRQFAKLVDEALNAFCCSVSPGFSGTCKWKRFLESRCDCRWNWHAFQSEETDGLYQTYQNGRNEMKALQQTEKEGHPKRTLKYQVEILSYLTVNAFFECLFRFRGERTDSRLTSLPSFLLVNLRLPSMVYTLKKKKNVSFLAFDNCVTSTGLELRDLLD